MRANQTISGTPFFALFRTRLFLLVLLLVVPAFALVLFGNLEQRRIERAKVREGAVAISQLAAANQQNFIKNTRQLLATLTQFPFLVLATNRPFCETHFSNLLKLSPDYLNFGLIEADGTVFCSGIPTNTAVSLADRSYFQRAVETKQFSIGDFQIGRLTGQPALNFGYPVFDERGEFKRVLFASLKLSLLSEAVAQVEIPTGGTITVFDRRGNVLARRPEVDKWVGKSLSAVPLVQRILRQREGVVEMPGVDDVLRLHAVTAIKDSQSPSLFVSVGIPVAVSYARANQALIRNFIILGLVAVVVLGVARFYSQRFFLRPVNALASAADSLAKGNLKARTGITSGASELDQLARAFDDMAETLERRQAELNRANAEISRMNAELEQRIKERTAQLVVVNEELEAFSYSVSHDLRAPLRHIDGFAQMLDAHSASGLDEKGKRYLSVIGDAAKKMGNLIDDLLVFSRMGRKELRQSGVDTEQIVREVIREMADETQGRSIEWVIGELPRICGDPTMFKQVWVNLIANAVKYTRPRERARIEIGRADGPIGEVVFHVRDNGVGFDMQYAAKLFGVFQRLHRESEFEGTGIGLANVRRVVIRHGGRTWAESRIGEGSTFYFSVPNADLSGVNTADPPDEPAC